MRTTCLLPILALASSLAVGDPLQDAARRLLPPPPPEEPAMNSPAASGIVLATAEFPPMRHGLKAVFGQHGNDHGGDFTKRVPRMIAQLNELGVDLTRIEFKWAINEPERGRYDWSEADRLIDALHAGGIEPMLMMYCPPNWAMIGPPEDEEYFIRRGFENLYTVVWAEEQYKDDLRRFAEAGARRYRGKTNLFEFWNEPDGMAGPVVLRDASGAAVSVRFGGDPVQYTDWLKVFYEGVKAGNPDALVAAGSLCEPNTHFVEAMYACGAADYCDAISVHPYPYHSDQIHIAILEAIRAVMVRYGDWDKPIWVTEFGWTTGSDLVDPVNPKPTTGMEKQAALIEPMFELVSALPYISQFYFFTLNDWGGSVENRGSINGFGLVDLELNPKPSYEVYRRVVAASPRKPRLVTAPPLSLYGPPGAIDVLPGAFAAVEVTVTIPGEHPPTHVLATGEAIDAAMPAPVAGARQQVKTTVSVRAREDARPGTYRLALHCPGAESDTVQLTVPARAPRLTAPPAIDGSLDDWAGRLNIEQERFSAGFAWDDAGLYLACAFRAPAHTPGTATPEIWFDDDLWRFDSLQLGLDPLRDAVRGSRFRPDDSEYLFALTTTGVETRRYAARDGKHVGPVLEGKTAIQRADGETRYEVFLPWDDIHPAGRPQPGAVLGAALLLNEVDGAERRMHAWGNGIGDAKLPYRYASIVLVER